MNQLSTINKSIRQISEAYQKIKTEETRKKADIAIRGLVWMYTQGAGESGASVGTETVGGATVSIVAEMGVSGQESGKEGALGVQGSNAVVTSTSGGVTTVYPKGYVFSKEEPKVEGDVGDTGTFYTETVVTEPAVEAPKPEEVGGWPVRGEIEVIGLAPNRRMLRGRLVDGRVVNMERTIRVWKAADRVVGKLVRAGSSPLYRVG